jgi:myo-inositol-1(or 4)-monophosphatase
MNRSDGELERLLEGAWSAAEAGARVLASWFRSRELQASTKGENDFVTQADRESERAVVSELLRRFPKHGIRAEEGTLHSGTASEYEWIIDPLDGTTNFLQGLPIWSVSIACRREGELLVGVVFDPLGGNRFEAIRGGGAKWNGQVIRVSSRAGLPGAFLATGFPFRAQAALDLYLAYFREVFRCSRAIRRCGSAALDLAFTAAGVYDGFFELRLSPWDVAAGALLLREAGGRLSDLDGGNGWFASGNVLAGNPSVVADLVRCAQGRISEQAVDALVPRPPGA